MNGCWETGGPEWLFQLSVAGLFSAVVALGLFLALQGNARLDAKPGKDPERHRQGQRYALFSVALFVVLDRAQKGLVEDVAFPILMLLPVAAAVLTVRAARRQAADVPLIYLMPLSVVRGPTRWSVAVTGVAGVGTALTALAVSYGLGHSC